jgi:protein-tyrosine phosphatase
VPEIRDRRLAIEGTLNFRDLGGYAGTGRHRVRWGLVYRSDNLAALTVSGWSVMAGLGLRSVFDLRHEVERQRSPTAIPAGLDIHSTHLPVGGEAAEAPDVVELLGRKRGAQFGVDFMIDMYETLLREHAPVFGTLLTALADPARLPAVFHCTAGKDRTGIAAALLLSALGVDRQQVLDDYELTTVLRSEQRIAELRPALEEVGVDVEAVRPFLSAPRPALESALAALDRTHGGIEGYLLGAAGVRLETLDALRRTLLD